MFEDLHEANERFKANFRDSGMQGRAARGLAVLTCIDSRIDPLAMLGLVPGDAKIVRNAGARATDDALRSLVLATNLLGVDRICVVPHTECAMVGQSDDDLRERIGGLRDADASGWTFEATTDQLTSVRADLERIRDCELISEEVAVGALLFDVHTGALEPLDV
jgi:carbonic anhydrase